jgi:hypothetical protein
LSLIDLHQCRSIAPLLVHNSGSICDPAVPQRRDLYVHAAALVWPAIIASSVFTPRRRGVRISSAGVDFEPLASG